MAAAAPCPVCQCRDASPGSAMAHAVLAALIVDDLDRALAAGLLDCAGCSGCSRGCNTQVGDARDARLRALAARERHRARAARLALRAREKERRRRGRETANATMALPPAAAAALARAKAKAASKP